MSTKSTIASGDGWHLYDELMDDTVWLQVDSGKFDYNLCGHAADVEVPLEAREAMARNLIWNSVGRACRANAWARVSESGEVTSVANSPGSLEGKPGRLVQLVEVVEEVTADERIREAYEMGRNYAKRADEHAAWLVKMGLKPLADALNGRPGSGTEVAR